MIKIDYCPICKSEDLNIIKEYNYQYPDKKVHPYSEERLRILFDYIFKEDRNKIIKYIINKCNDCGFIFLNPRLNNEEIKTKYKQLTKDNSLILSMSTEDELREKRVKDIVHKYCKGGSLLDFGGANGRICINLKEEYECSIVDIVRYKNIYEEIEYLGNDVKDIKNEYDIIMLIHILEHTNHPLELIESLKIYLKDKGIIIIAVPAGYINEWANRVEPLTHCNFFNQDSLKRCIEKAGYDMLEIKEYSEDYKEIYIIGTKYD